MTANRIPALLITLMAIAALAAVVQVAIGADKLAALIGGVAVLGAVVIVAGWMIARNIVVPLLEAKTKRDGMRYEFIQAMAAKGALPNDGSFVPIRAQLAAPQPTSRAIARLQIIDFNPNDMRTASVNYIMFTAALLGDDRQPACLCA